MTSGEVNGQTIKQLETKLKHQVGAKHIPQILLDIIQLTSLTFHQIVIVSYKDNVLTLADEVQVVKLSVNNGIGKVVENVSKKIESNRIQEKNQLGDSSTPIFKTSRLPKFKSRRTNGIQIQPVNPKLKLLQGGKTGA